MTFINRENELKNMEKEYERSDSSFMVIYGRRRVGKTTLIKEFIKNKNAVYYLSDTQNESIQVNRFKDIISDLWCDDVLKKLEVNTWDNIFNYIIKHIPLKEKPVIVIDEFQYLVKANKDIPSIFQRLWDESLKSMNIMLILSGSIISMMYSSVLSYNSPLYGRRTAQIKLNPLSFKDFTNFFPGKSAVRLIELYSILSGVPKYIEIFEDNDDLFQAVETNILNKDAFLYFEPIYMLNEELTETTTYFSMLEVISRGDHKIGNIATKLQIPTNHLTSFLNRLIELELLERETPVTEENPAKSKKGLYFIKDHFFRFWFRYVLPYRSYIEMGNSKYALDKIRQSFHLYVSDTFEKVCREYILRSRPFEIQKVGRWWNNNEEIDVVAIGESEILLGECKWWDDKVGVNVLDDLVRKSTLVENLNKYNHVHFAVFSKNGFTKELEQASVDRKNIHLYDFSHETKRLLF